jgi:hypothetical protein
VPGIAGIGVLGGVLGTWRKLPAPGSRKSSGETLFDALMPPHPAPNIERAEKNASHSHLPFDLTQ